MVGKEEMQLEMAMAAQADKLFLIPNSLIYISIKRFKEVRVVRLMVAAMAA